MAAWLLPRDAIPSNMELAGNLSTAVTNRLQMLLNGLFSFCEEKMPLCSVLDCNNRSKKGKSNINYLSQLT